MTISPDVARPASTGVATTAVLLIGVLFGPGPSAGQLSTVQTDSIDALFASMDRIDAPGCALGVVQDGALVYGRGYGMANLEHGLALDTRSVFRMGSVGKQFTAAVVALLALDGSVDLDADIRAYLPELPDFGTPVTVRQLLHHTSGYRDYLTLVVLAGARAEDYYDDPELYLLLTRQEELNFPPGSDQLYSNSGYFLLGQLVLRVTGRSLAQVARERIFDPLGMQTTHYHDHWRRVVPGRATGYAPAEWYRPGPGGAEVRDDVWPGYVVGSWADGRDPFAGSEWVIDVTTLPMIGDGGVFSSVEEMVPWIGHLLAPRPEAGGEPWAALMRSRGVLNSGDTLGYALGLVHGEQRGLATLGHGGSFVGYRAAVQSWPETATGVVVLCNRADARPSGLAGAVGAVVLGDRMEPPEPAEGADAREPNPAPETRPVRPDEVAGLAGTFRSAELAATWTVQPEAGGLRLHLGGVPGPMLEAEAPEVLRGGGIRLRYQRDAQGAATGFRADAGRVRNLRFEKVTPGG